MLLPSDERRVKILEDGEARARRAYDAGRIRYNLGIDDITAVLSAEQTWRTDRTQLTAQRVQALRRAVQTYKALGGGWDYADHKNGLPVAMRRLETMTKWGIAAVDGGSRSLAACAACGRQAAAAGCAGRAGGQRRARRDAPDRRRHRHVRRADRRATRLRSIPTWPATGCPSSMSTRATG